MVRENRFVTTREAVATVNNLATASSLNGGHLGMTTNIKRVLAYTRFKAHGRVSLGDTRSDVVIPAGFQKTNDDRLFLLHGNHDGDNRMLVFATADSLDVRLTFKHILSWFQILQIHLL